MNCLLVNTYDTEGGASRAAYRLHTGLRGIGVESRMLVQVKYSHDPFVTGPGGKLARRVGRLRSCLDRLPLQFYRGRRKGVWGLSWLPGKTLDRICGLNPDVVHLHWIGDGFLPVADLARLNRPVVWTLHDSWAFTGGCHVPHQCTGYRNSCLDCPQLGSSTVSGIPHWVWKQKAKHWRGLNLTVVTPSRWLADCAGASSLFKDVRVEVIPNGLDLGRFSPADRGVAREVMGLPRDKKIILFGSVNSTGDPNKGFQFLREATELMAQHGWEEKAELVVFGSSEPASPPRLGLKTSYLGRIYDDDRLVLLYSAADVLVAPSIQENLSSTVMEAMACGTPCVAFDIGGMPDLIDHRHNGYLARPFRVDDLAQGMEWVISDHDRQSKLSETCREKVEREFSLEKVARKYLSIYYDISYALNGNIW